LTVLLKDTFSQIFPLQQAVTAFKQSHEPSMNMMVRSVGENFKKLE